MKKRIFSVLLALVMTAALGVSALAFDYMNPPKPGAADGWYEVKNEWQSDNLLAGHDSTETSYTFDSLGRVSSRTETFTDFDDPERNHQYTYLYEYDDQGRLSRIVGSDVNHETVYSYNDDGTHFLTNSWSGGGVTLLQTYDPCEDWYWYNEWFFEFDEHGNTTRRWEKNGMISVDYTNTYDEQGRLTEARMNSGYMYNGRWNDLGEELKTITYHDDGSYVKTWDHKGGSEIFTYNALGQLVKYEVMDEEMSREGCTYEYDEHGNCTRIFYNENTHRDMTYEKLPLPDEPVMFADVPADAYFADPVSWAVSHEPQITQGVGGNLFAPESKCTRSQIVTFLWRAKGCPEPATTENPFTDVAPDAYYYKAVLWAVENGITGGTGGGMFSPDANCTRAQAVTFLWRADGKPAPKTQVSQFTDVQDAGAYFYTPVLWAVENGITSGTGGGMFSPDNDCTRAQIVTFLYRDMA